MAGSLSMVAGHLAKYLELFGGDLEAKHHTAALRYVTFTVLGIPHTCCDPHGLRYIDDTSSFLEEVAETEDEHAHELGQLEELLEEFEGEVLKILQDANQAVADVISFWKRTWVNRMRDVLDRLNGNDLEDDKRRAAEEIGVKWYGPRPPKVRDNPHKKHTIEHWRHEMEKIMAECR